jgi:hypothetical protein
MKTKSLQFAELTDKASRIVGKVGGIEKAAPDLVAFLCGWFDCQWGTYWHVDSRKLLLTPAFCWNNESLRAEKLRRDTDSKSLTLSEGTAGHVWRTGKPVCTDNIVRDMCLPRSLDATEVGLRSGIWFPIRTPKMTIGVVELLGRHYWARELRFVGELELLGLALGERATAKRT